MDIQTHLPWIRISVVYAQFMSWIPRIGHQTLHYVDMDLTDALPPREVLYHLQVYADNKPG